MNTNNLTAAISAYELLSDSEKDLFYKVIYRHSDEEKACQDLCESNDSVKEPPLTDIQKAFKDYVEGKRVSFPDLFQKGSDSVRVIRNRNGVICGYGLIE